MNLSQAVSTGICRIRRPCWSNEKAYLKIDLINGGHGPCSYLFDRVDQKIFDEPTPQTILSINFTTVDFVEYTGELDPADT